MKTKPSKYVEAIIRNTEWAKHTPVQQLAYLDTQGFAAAKQRAKLAKKLG